MLTQTRGAERPILAGSTFGRAARSNQCPRQFVPRKPVPKWHQVANGRRALTTCQKTQPCRRGACAADARVSRQHITRSLCRRRWKSFARWGVHMRSLQRIPNSATESSAACAPSAPQSLAPSAGEICFALRLRRRSSLTACALRMPVIFGELTNHSCRNGWSSRSLP